MDISEAMAERRSVRRYTDRQPSPDALAAVENEIAVCNREGGLHMKLILNEPEAFSGLLPRMGKFSGVRSYIVLAGPDGPELFEKSGYYGERVVLLARQLGLGTCWVGGSFSRRRVRRFVKLGDRLVCVIALGIGAEQGTVHRSKPLEKVCRAGGNAPVWFIRGAEAALLAPTAMDQQRFLLTLLDGGRVRAESTGGPYSKVDLGIVKLHFELGAGRERFTWAE